MVLFPQALDFLTPCGRTKAMQTVGELVESAVKSSLLLGEGSQAQRAACKFTDVAVQHNSDAPQRERTFGK